MRGPWLLQSPQETHSTQPTSTSFLIFSLRLSLSFISHHISGFHMNSSATTHTSHNITPMLLHALAFRQLSLAQFCCPVPSLIKNMNHWNQCKYFPWLQWTLEQACDNLLCLTKRVLTAHLKSVMTLPLPEVESTMCPRSVVCPFSSFCNPSHLVLLTCSSHLWGADPVLVRCRCLCACGSYKEGWGVEAGAVFPLKTCFCVSCVIWTVDPKYQNYIS